MDLLRLQCTTLVAVVLLFIVGGIIQLARQQTHLFNAATDYPDHLLAHSYAVLVSTNIVSQPCNCGFCDNARGIRVPEHVGVIGYDLRIEVSTNYLPIVTILR